MVCIILVKIARNIIGIGTSKGIKEAKIINTISSPFIFPKSLSVNVRGLAR